MLCNIMNHSGLCENFKTNMECIIYDLEIPNLASFVFNLSYVLCEVVPELAIPSSFSFTAVLSLCIYTTFQWFAVEASGSLFNNIKEDDFITLIPIL